MNDITVIKQNHVGVEVFRYEGAILARSADEILIEGRFGLHGRHMVDIPLSFGDRFLETYYTQRWYNIYEVRAHDDDQLKCWYCNVAYPAEIGEGQLIFRDLALDLLVYPDGRQLVLDEDEFSALDLASEIKKKAEHGLEELKKHFHERFAK